MRSLMRWTPSLLPAVEDLRREFDRFFDETEGLMPNLLRSSRAGGWMPAVDIRETADEVVVEAELPGVRKEDIDVRIEDNTLFLRGERKEEHEERHGDFFRTERSFGTFQRAFTLPSPIDSQKVRAVFRNGMLTLHLPKSEQAKARQITIKESE